MRKHGLSVYGKRLLPGWAAALRYVGEGLFDQETGLLQMLQEFGDIGTGSFGIRIVFRENCGNKGVHGLLRLEFFEEKAAKLIETDNAGKDSACLTAGDGNHLIQDLSDVKSADNMHG